MTSSLAVYRHVVRVFILVISTNIPFGDIFDCNIIPHLCEKVCSYRFQKLKGFSFVAAIYLSLSLAFLHCFQALQSVWIAHPNLWTNSCYLSYDWNNLRLKTIFLLFDLLPIWLCHEQQLLFVSTYWIGVCRWWFSFGINNAGCLQFTVERTRDIVHRAVVWRHSYLLCVDVVLLPFSLFMEFKMIRLTFKASRQRVCGLCPSSKEGNPQY